MEISRPDGERENLLLPFPNVLQTSFFQSLSPIFFLHSPSILTWTKGGKKQRRVIGSGDTRDAYNLDGATGIPPPPPTFPPLPSRRKKNQGLCPHTHMHARRPTLFWGKLFFFSSFPTAIISYFSFLKNVHQRKNEIISE